MSVSNLLTEVLSEGGEAFYRIENNDGKVWLMPVGRLRTAMHLYQPSGRNGKLLKRWLPVLHRLPLMKRKLHIKTIRCCLAEDLYDKLCKLFMTERVEFALFCGTPCVHQKLTIQISKGQKILGYCKVSDRSEIVSMFDRERELLTQLERHGIDLVPRVLFAGEWRSGIHLLVQTTAKSSRSRVIHEWGRLHEEFLDDLFKKTKRVMPFEETDYCRTLSELREHLDWLPSDESKAIVGSAINKVFMGHKGRMVEYGVYHADFTPWNMFVDRGRLFVFDWEYAMKTYPPMLDRYHFFMQTAIFEKHWQAEEIKVYIHSGDGSWIDSATYRLYLLDIIARFTMRERGNICGDVAFTMNIWIELLKGLNE